MNPSVAKVVDIIEATDLFIDEAAQFAAALLEHTMGCACERNGVLSLASIDVDVAVDRYRARSGSA